MKFLLASLKTLTHSVILMIVPTVASEYLVRLSYSVSGQLSRVCNGAYY